MGDRRRSGFGGECGCNDELGILKIPRRPRRSPAPAVVEAARSARPNEQSHELFEQLIAKLQLWGACMHIAARAFDASTVAMKAARTIFALVFAVCAVGFAPTSAASYPPAGYGVCIEDGGISDCTTPFQG